MSKLMTPPKSDFDAVFLGWQSTILNEISPLFNITISGHPLYNSTVGESTLRRLHMRVPRTPSPYPDTPQPPWQKLGIELNHPRNASKAIEMAGLNYTVVKKPLGMKTGLKQESYATMRTDTGDILGVVGESYEPVQNIDAFAFFDTIIAEDEATYETAGVLGKGEGIWILAKLPGFMKVHGNDIVNKYLLLTNSHDGGLQIQVRLTPIRVVCNNTLTAALQGDGDIAVSYSSDPASYLEQAFTILRLSDSLYAQLDVMFNAMASRKITQQQLQDYVQALIPDNEEAENTARTEKIRTIVLHLHDSGHGSSLAKGTAWGAFNSVAEYTDHLMSDEDSTTRLNSIWFGRGEQLKAKAFDLAQRMLM
ncbi:MAG: DUF932 domain-containing protein [Smithella sp.]